MRKAMHYNNEGNNNLVWFTITSIAGLIKFFHGATYEVQMLQVNWITVFAHVWEAGIVALACGFLGVLGKEGAKLIIEKLKNKNKK